MRDRAKEEKGTHELTRRIRNLTWLRKKERAGEGNHVKNISCYCIPNLQKLVHQVPLCGRYLLVYNIITTTRSYKYQQYILFSAFFTLQLVSLNSQLSERRAFLFCRAVGGIDFFNRLQHGCSQNLQVFFILSQVSPHTHQQ